MTPSFPFIIYKRQGAYYITLISFLFLKFSVLVHILFFKILLNYQSSLDCFFLDFNFLHLNYQSSADFVQIHSVFVKIGSTLI